MNMVVHGTECVTSKNNLIYLIILDECRMVLITFSDQAFHVLVLSFCVSSATNHHQAIICFCG